MSISRSMPIDRDLLIGFREQLRTTRSFREAGSWLDRQIEARNAMVTGTRCPDCHRAECNCDKQSTVSTE